MHKQIGRGKREAHPHAGNILLVLPIDLGLDGVGQLEDFAALIGTLVLTMARPTTQEAWLLLELLQSTKKPKVKGEKHALTASFAHEAQNNTLGYPSR